VAAVLKGEAPTTGMRGTFGITRSLPNGHVAAAQGTIRALGVEELISPVPSRQRDLVTAMVTAAVIDGSSKLASAPGAARRDRRQHAGWAARPAAIGVQPVDQAAAVAGPVAGQPGHRDLPGAGGRGSPGDPAPPQVRDRGGLIDWPHSSSKTIQRRNLRARSLGR
jgi:hypothetical protein